MTHHEEAADYIAAMCGRRRNLTPNERDILYQLLDTPTVRVRFPMLSHEELKTIADQVAAQPRPARRRVRAR